jgi:hypothetical protein
MFDGNMVKRRMWTPAHTRSKMRRTPPSRPIVIELKDQPRHPKSLPLALDPVKLDATHHPVLLENDRVRVLHTILVPT